QENLIDDLRQFVLVLQKKHPGAPVYILGESMGGALAITALSEPDFPKVQGVVLSAPAVWGEETMHPFYRFTLWMAAHTVPSRTFTGSDLQIQASNNFPMLRRMAYDPIIIKSTRTDAVYGMVGLMDTAYSKVPKLQ